MKAVRKPKLQLWLGWYMPNNEPIEKAGMKVPRDSELKVKGSVHPYVGRGGLKLEKAIRHFEPRYEWHVMLDMVHPPEDLRIVHFSMARSMYMLLMWDIISWTGRCVMTSGLLLWNEQFPLYDS